MIHTLQLSGCIGIRTLEIVPLNIFVIDQPISSFYFVVSGNVLVERIEIDKITGVRHIQVRKSIILQISV